MPEPDERLSAVIDTKLLVSGLLLKHGTSFAIVNAIRKSAFTPVISDPLYQEYQEVLVRPKFAEKYGVTPEEVADLLLVIALTAYKVSPEGSLPVPVRDQKDEEVLAAAIAGKVDYLVTNDRDLLTLRDTPALGSLKIVTPGEFLTALRVAT
jgi:uncharacterized protein